MEKNKINELEKVVNLRGLLGYMISHHKDCDNLIHKYNDISIAVWDRNKYLNKDEKNLESVKIMKEYLKDTNQ